VRLPAGGLPQFGERGAAGPPEQVEDLGGLAAVAGRAGSSLRAGPLAAFAAGVACGGLLGRAGRVGRVGLGGRDTGLACAGGGLPGGFVLRRRRRCWGAFRHGRYLGIRGCHRVLLARGFRGHDIDPFHEKAQSSQDAVAAFLCFFLQQAQCRVFCVNDSPASAVFG
jgi:hypothetical protein